MSNQRTVRVSVDLLDFMGEQSFERFIDHLAEKSIEGVWLIDIDYKFTALNEDGTIEIEVTGEVDEETERTEK